MAAAGEDARLEAARAWTDALYRQHRRAVLRICRALLRDRSEAEDAMQQVFLSAHGALLRGAEPREPLAWLATIARRECWTRGARASAAATAVEDGAAGANGDVPADAIRNADLAALWSAIAELPSTQREALLLREIRGLSYRQLGSELALSAPATRSLLARARRRVRLRLRDVHGALGGAPWIDALARAFAGGTNPAAPAARAAAVGLGAAAIAGGALVSPASLEHHSVRRAAPPVRTHAAPRPPVHVARPAPPAPRVQAVHVVRARVARPVAVRAAAPEHPERSVEHRRGDHHSSPGGPPPPAPALVAVARETHDGGDSTPASSGETQPTGSVTAVASEGDRSGGDGGDTPAATTPATTVPVQEDGHDGGGGDVTPTLALPDGGGGGTDGGGGGGTDGGGDHGGGDGSGDDGH